MLILCMFLQVIYEVKVTYQGEGHFDVSVENLSLTSHCSEILHSLILYIVLHSFFVNVNVTGQKWK